MSVADAQAGGDTGADFVVLTGMSGAGRSTVAHAMEDQSWFIVDNLPPQLLGPLARLASGRKVQRPGARIAAVVDVRSQEFFAELDRALDELAEGGWRPQLVFLDATDEALVRRFESVRRPHPLQRDGRLLDGILAERELLRDLRSRADIVIDTSGLNVHQLSRKVEPMFSPTSGPAVRLAIMSFGFKYGIPLDADFVFDMRFLPNPFWIPELRNLNGRDVEVSTFVMAQPGAPEFVEHVVELLGSVLEGYRREGRRYVTIAVGCTGGKHRSVAMAEALSQTLVSPDVATFPVHRDLGRE
jgi:UPF0042 nucleotide-binding protein